MPNHQATIEGGDPTDNNALVDMFKASLTDENLAFVWAVNHYRSPVKPGPTISIPTKVVSIGGMVPFEHHGSHNTMGRWIYETYVGPDAPREVNLSAGHLKELKSAYDSGALTIAVFDGAYGRIMNMLNGMGKYGAASGM